MHIASYTPQDFCHRLKTLCKTEFPTLTARPWNRFDPENSLWWLIPSSEWPAYRFAKFYFDWADLHDSGLLCGLHVEKGLDESVRAAYPSKKGSQFILTSEWAWKGFISDLAGGTFGKAVLAASSDIVSDFELRIGGGYVKDPTSFDPYAPEFKAIKATYKFVCAGRTLKCELSELKDPLGLMSSLVGVKSLKTCASLLADVARNGWLWIDFWFGIKLVPAKNGEGVSLLCIQDLWSRYLKHFSVWVRA